MQVTLAESEEATLFAVYSALRSAELAIDGWESSLRAALLRQQFDAHRRGYQAQFPAACEMLIRADGTPAGRAVIDRSPPVWRLIDIGVIPEARRRGIATQVIRQCQAEAAAAQCAIALSVLVDNDAALALYDRLGFHVVEGDQIRRQMEWRSR